MIVKVNKVKFDETKNGYINEINYDIDIKDEKLVNGITTKFPVYWYVLIDGKLFKSDQRSGLKSIYFSSKDDAKNALADALYWRRRLVPDIGSGVGYDTDDFYKKLIQTHNVEFKKMQF